MNTHAIELTGYCAKSPDWPALHLGTAGSYGNEQLAVTLGQGWQGLTVTASFQPADVTVLVPDDGVLDVPWEATETALDVKSGRIVFKGVADGRVLISADVPYTVGSHSDTEGSNSQPPTPSQWQQFVDEVKTDADRAESAAKDAEATLQDVEDAGAQAVIDIGAAKDRALDAVEKAGEEVAGSIAADIQAAKDAAAAAEQSAKDAAAELPKVQQAGQTALDDIATERENSISALEDEGTKQQSSIASAGTSALEAIQQAGQAVTGQITQTGATQVGAVQSAGTTQVGLVNSAGQQQAENVAQAGAQQVQAVQTAGTSAVGTVNDARDDAVEEIETANAHAPQINSATGYWQTWDAETGEYVDTTTKAQGPQGGKGDTGAPGLGVPTPTANDYGKAPTVNAAGTGYELTGPYAPLSAAIVETAKGSTAVCEDSIEWGLQGMRVYGKSTQDGTPSPENPVPIISAGDDGAIEVLATGKNLLDISKMQQTTKNGITFSLENGGIKINGTATDRTDSPIFAFRLPAGTYISNMNGTRFPWLWAVSYVVEKKDGSLFYINAGQAFTVLDEYVGKYFYFAVEKGKAVNEIIYPQLEVGSTATSYEPYQSQSLTFSTPNGLPGIPVDSGGNYTDAEGQIFFSSFRDYASKTDVTRVKSFHVDTSPDSVWYSENTGEYVDLYTYDALNDY